MFSIGPSSSKREQQQDDQHRAPSPPPPPPPNPRPDTQLATVFGRKRARTTLPRLSPSLSCPHLPLFAMGTSSPPAVTPAVALGATTPTTEFWGRAREEDTTPSGGTSSRRLSMTGFPWETRGSSSGRMSPAAELTGTIARRSRPATPPAQLLVHEPANGFKDRISPKSNLRLELPAPGISSLQQQQQQQRRHTIDPNICNRHRGGFVGQPLLGLAYPTTPDIGLNNLPIMCGACKESVNGQHGGADGGRGGMHNGRDGGGILGGATTAAQHALLAAGPHMVRGGLALLTPPDDNGILDWQQDGIQRIQADRETTVRMMTGIREFATSQAREPAATEQVRVGPHDRGERADTDIDSDALPAVSNASNPAIKPERETFEDDPAAPTDGDWIGSAMETLVGSAFPVCMSTEAVRVLSYTLPCPLPDAPGPDAPSSSSNPTNPDRLPISAISAPAVAAAAGQQLSPMVLARCTTGNAGVSVPVRSVDWGTTTALHHMTAAIQQRYQREGTRRVYIHVSHAIDPQIPLSRLPSTPPITGSLTGGNESDVGYFTPTVFSSIVIAPNSLASTPVPGTPLLTHPPPPLSNPILPPSSLHLTLLERYIPPATQAEDTAMFSTRSSLLVDRLFELSSQGGSLLFIYPTKTGAMDFDRDYLGPVLDPLLRKLMVLYRLREGLLWGVRNMSSMPHMAEFDVLRSRIEAFCAALTNGEGDLPRMPTTVVYSSKARVSLNELSWREWWTQQEQVRVREIVKKHGNSQAAAAATAATATASNKGKETEDSKSGFWTGYGVPGDLAREILDGVRAPTVRPSSRGMGEAVLASSMSGSGCGVGSVAPVGVGRIAGGIRRLETIKNRGVEVGIFILQRGS